MQLAKRVKFLQKFHPDAIADLTLCLKTNYKLGRTIKETTANKTKSLSKLNFKAEDFWYVLIYKKDPRYEMSSPYNKRKQKQ